MKIIIDNQSTKPSEIVLCLAEYYYAGKVGVPKMTQLFHRRMRENNVRIGISYFTGGITFTVVDADSPIKKPDPMPDLKTQLFTAARSARESYDRARAKWGEFEFITNNAYSMFRAFYALIEDAGLEREYLDWKRGEQEKEICDEKR